MDRRRRRVAYHQHRGDGLEREKIRVLSGVVYKKKRRRPRTEPWGTSQEQV